MPVKPPPEPIAVLVILIVVALVGGLLWWVIRQTEKRTDGFRQFAESRSLRFIGRSTKFLHYFSAFDLFTRRSTPRTRQLSNLIHGPIRDCDIWIFDYYDTQVFSSKGSWARQSVICIESEALSLPRFSVLPVKIEHETNGAGGLFAPRRILKRMTRRLERDEIELAGRNKFYEKYRIGGPNAQAIQRLFDTSVNEMLEQLGSVSVEGDGCKMLIYRESRMAPVADLPEFVGEAISLYSLLKSSRSGRVGPSLD
jgi:hypothetical protein